MGEGRGRGGLSHCHMSHIVTLDVLLLPTMFDVKVRQKRKSPTEVRPEEARANQVLSYDSTIFTSPARTE